AAGEGEITADKQLATGVDCQGIYRAVEAAAERRPTRSVPFGDIGGEDTSRVIEDTAGKNLRADAGDGVNRSPDAVAQNGPATPRQSNQVGGRTGGKNSAEENFGAGNANGQDISVHAGVFLFQQRRPGAESFVPFRHVTNGGAACAGERAAHIKLACRHGQGPGRTIQAAAQDGPGAAIPFGNIVGAINDARAAELPRGVNLAIVFHRDGRDRTVETFGQRRPTNTIPMRDMADPERAG